jgi:N utilization substance protein B
MSARGKARKRALDILYEAEMRRESPLILLADRVGHASPPISPYAAELIRGVQANRDAIDELLGEYSQGWALDRMPAVDRNILRIGTYELLWCADVPDPVAISEAVLLAGDLSTDSSSAFVNGLLARLLEIKPTLSLGSAAADTEVEAGTDVAAGSDVEGELAAAPQADCQ